MVHLTDVLTAIFLILGIASGIIIFLLMKENPIYCFKNMQCPGNKQCFNGKCAECVRHYECEHFCLNNTCVDCLDSEDCESNLCIDNVCSLCQGPDSCQENEACVYGHCTDMKEGTVCTNNSHCNTGLRCLDSDEGGKICTMN